MQLHYVIITGFTLTMLYSVLASTCSASIECGLQGGREWGQVSGGLSMAAAVISQRLPPRQGGWSLVSGRQYNFLLKLIRNGLKV